MNKLCLEGLSPPSRDAASDDNAPRHQWQLRSGFTIVGSTRAQ
jgi:hypothetical protein